VFAGIGAPLNPGNPHIHSKTENGFGTFGGPDFAGTLGEVATKALNACGIKSGLSTSVLGRRRQEDLFI